MTPRTRYRIGTVVLGIAIVGLLFHLLEMLEVIPVYVPKQQLSVTVLIFVVLATALRRSARSAMSAPRQDT